MNLPDEPKRPARVIVAIGIDMVISLLFWGFATYLSDKLSHSSAHWPFWPGAAMDRLFQRIDDLGTLPAYLILLLVLAIGLGFFSCLNGLNDRPKHDDLRHYIRWWIYSKAFNLALLYFIAGIVLLVNSGQYNRLLALPLFLPAVLFAIYIWHLRRLSRLAAKFPQPLSATY